MKVKDFIESVSENAVIEIELPLKIIKKADYIVEQHGYKSSLYNDLSEFYDREVVDVQKTMSPIYRLLGDAESVSGDFYRLTIR